ncbi:MAG: YidC/Oxa1 family membrane protein insertase [Lachnospiraceae bacterium]|jgi:YidC/Oxa1 family membrane protein insertase|nr:YidC/Oxa1 family membrane protein insertase [Lachnospiraceae bacterium]
MDFILLTKDSTFIIGQVAWLLGQIMNGIFYVIDFIGIPNIGLAIILFTIVVNLLMMPLNIRQQKFSKLSAKINPEMQLIEKKYKGKSDQQSLMAKNMEIQELYAKYGISPRGSCIQLLIQFPILLALYRVINSMPAYVTQIRDTFKILATAIIDKDGGGFLQNSGIESIANTVSMYGRAMTDGDLTNGIIDVLNKLSSSDLLEVAKNYDLTNLEYQGRLILSNDTTRGLIDTYNNFLGLNMADSPGTLIRNAWAVGAWGIVIGAVLIPILSAVTQWINVKLMPQQPTNGNDKASSMAASMKTMNMVMPLISAWFCFSFPAGMGLYWVAGSVVRSIQQIVINKHIDKMDFNDIIAQNSEKSAKKLEKLKASQERMNAYASMNTKKVQNKANIMSGMSEQEKEEAMNKATEYYNSGNAKPGSMMAKANMVRQYNEKNNKK